MVKKLIYQFNDNNVNGKVYELRPKIYAIVIKNDYDRAMFFYRYQEYYESPYKEIKGKYFSLHEFMKLYMDKRKIKNFRYHQDWGGFNLPSEIIETAIPLFRKDNDIYNNLFVNVFNMCKKYTIKNYGKNEKFYLIGVDKCSGIIMKHEIAHGFFYVNKEYRNKMIELIKTIEHKKLYIMKKKLITLGYNNERDILFDELQAYISTNDSKKLDANSVSSNYSEFIKTFNNFYKTK